MGKNILTIKEYFDKGDSDKRTFVIPNYQRGYKWGVPNKDKSCAVSVLMDNLLEAYRGKRESSEYFLEAVTVVEEGEGQNKSIILVDGQQRTTTLFLIFVGLGQSEFLRSVSIEYNVREDSHHYLNNLVSTEKTKINDEDVQDIYYFNKALEVIGSYIEKIVTVEKKYTNQDSFVNFILEKVKLLYNVIPQNKATSTFISLNGLKAIMKDEELIKSDLLIKSSRGNNNTSITDLELVLGLEWKINEDRGRLARNWDKWLYWWNQENVRDYFGIQKKQHPLYYLLVTYWNIEQKNEKGEEKKDFSFNNFKEEFITDAKTAKLHFEGLRKLQKTFEDIYNEWKTYNLLGLALSYNDIINRKQTIQYFVNNLKSQENLERFTKWNLVGCDLKEIEDFKIENYREKVDKVRNLLEDPNLFIEAGKNQAYLQLLRMNVHDMNQRKFDFKTFVSKSLEHICPQNPDSNNDEFIQEHEEINKKSDGINSIGNLVLLVGDINSALSNHPLDKKKELLFNKIKNGFLLPHTLKVFSKSYGANNEVQLLYNSEKYWTFTDVINNKNYFFNELNEYYK